jgi:hypothetical protein
MADNSVESSEPTSERLRDFYRDPTYERRVVIFYDVLGWRSRIAEVGNRVAELGKLRRLILRHTRSLPIRPIHELKFSTFSDNIVITQKASEETPRLIMQIAFLQVAAAMEGFLLRGGMTVGEIIHDDECVFGPGLNRAYELETKVAVYPRFVLDPNVLSEFGFIGDLAVVENDIPFLDPFRLEFMAYMKNQHVFLDKQTAIDAGLPAPENSLPKYGDEQILGAILAKLNAQIRAPLGDKEWAKIAWLYDRIAVQLGVPFAKSYPRLRPN